MLIFLVSAMKRLKERAASIDRLKCGGGQYRSIGRLHQFRCGTAFLPIPPIKALLTALSGAKEVTGMQSPRLVGLCPAALSDAASGVLSRPVKLLA